jgi:hypothetical protein
LFYGQVLDGANVTLIDVPLYMKISFFFMDIFIEGKGKVVPGTKHHSMQMYVRVEV